MLFFFLDLLAMGCINAILVLGFNLEYGYAGILNFTYYTFAAIGAYVTAVTTMGAPPTNLGGETYILQWHLPWYLGLVMGGLASAILGLFMVFIAVRRLRSDYLAIVSISVGLIVWEIVTNDVGLFNGSNGIFGVQPITGSLPISEPGYTAVIFGVSFALLALFWWIARRIFRSPFGRVLRAVREDEVLAASYGKNVFGAQVWIVLIGSFMAGVAGGLLIQYVSAFNPAGFLPVETFVLLAALIIGGSGNFNGSIIGAFLIIEILTEVSRFVPDFGRADLVGAIRAILIGVVLILVLRFQPGGIMPESRIRLYGRRKRPLEEKAPQEQGAEQATGTEQ